jgi:hypothetical protein
MRLSVSITLLAAPLWGAITNLHVTGVTAQQAVLNYTTTDGVACTVLVSPTQIMGIPQPPYINDVNTAIFQNSNLDSRSGSLAIGNIRTFVIGQRASQLATASSANQLRHYSRSLQALTSYYGQLQCGSSQANFSFTTSNIPTGQTYGEPWLNDPSNPGDQPFPESLGGVTPESFIDPQRGTLQHRISLRGGPWSLFSGEFGNAYSQGQTTPCVTGAWTSPCNITSGGSGVTTVGTSTTPLILRPSLSYNGAYGTTWYGSYLNFDQLSVVLTGSVNSSTFNVIDACLSFNGGASCASAVQQQTLGTSTSTATFGSSPTSAFSPGTYGEIAWLLDTTPRFNMQEASPHAGTGTISGTTLTNTSSVGNYNGGSPNNDFFSLYWTSGGSGHIRISTSSISDACTSTSVEYVISSFTNGNTMVLSGSPPTGSVYWCEQNFVVMVWRATSPTDGSTVTLNTANLYIVQSGYPEYPDNGAGTACYNQSVFGGYFCLFGQFYWVNPTTSNIVWYGNLQAQSSGSVTNLWNTVGAPVGSPPQSSCIDQTKSNLTFYTVSYDPSGGGPLVIGGAFNPTSTPIQGTVPQSPIGIPQINNASVSSSTIYSDSWSIISPNDLTFTNLTPQTTTATSVVDQVVALDSTFIPSYFNQSDTGGYNCSLTGAVDINGVFYFSCVSIGQDSPGWVFAFSSGDGNPAHAGQSGGPQIVGAINTFNTPPTAVSSGQAALTGRSLHAIAETGGPWLAVDGNQYPPINTSVTSFPSSGPEPCTFYGLVGNSNDCILVIITSHTSGGSTGYEPYFASPVTPFKGSPGELRTTQVGDTACVTDTSSCAYGDQVNELITLMIKDYGSVPDAWVFQRNAYGAELPATGPVTLYWQSIQSSVAPTNVAALDQAVQVFWNPLTGCSGAPDPHGECMIQDSNEFHGHAEWRNGGASQVVNVPEWKIPGSPSGEISYPSIYQTMVGGFPSVVQYSSANVTPYAVSGVNYVQSSTPFSTVYGVPFEPDGGGHPNAAGINAALNESIRAFDNVPIQGGSYDPTFTNVSGQLYLYAPSTVIDADDFYTSGSVAPINRKLMATGAACGSHPLIDISSASTGNVIATDNTTPYQYCIARNTNECRTGSTAGETFVNCPGVAFFSSSNAICSGVATHGGVPLGVGNDICISNIASNANSISQYALNSTDYKGSNSRQVVTATARLRLVTGFEGNQLLPDNSWILYRSEFLNYQRPSMWMAKLPPYPAVDSVNRGTYEPIAVAINPLSSLGVNTALVEFGYMEYSQGGNYYCTTRADICQANAASIPTGNAPFKFASESAAGLSCASGCTVTIPAIPQRTLYYRVRYLSASSATILLGGWQALTTP